jgi:hypothetical protein
MAQTVTASRPVPLSEVRDLLEAADVIDITTQLKQLEDLLWSHRFPRDTHLFLLQAKGHLAHAVELLQDAIDLADHPLN